MAVSLTVLFQNASTNSASVVLYQKDPEAATGEYSIAWMAQAASPNMSVQFQWQETYNFVQGSTGVLATGVIFQAAQVLDADLSTANKVELELQDDDEFAFSEPTQGVSAGQLMIQNSSDVPMNSISEGIGMAGKGTFLVQAQPNSAFLFTPQPQYWIAFGDFSQGEVLDPSYMFGGKSLSSKSIYGLPTQIEFPNGVDTMVATLNADNSWTIAPQT